MSCHSCFLCLCCHRHPCRDARLGIQILLGDSLRNRHGYKKTGIRSEYRCGVYIAARPRIHTMQGVQTKGTMELKSSLSIQKTERTRTIMWVCVCSSQNAWHPSLSCAPSMVVFDTVKEAVVFLGSLWWGGTNLSSLWRLMSPGCVGMWQGSWATCCENV